MRRTLIGFLSVVVIGLAAATPAAAGGRPLTADLSAANEVGGGDGDATGFAFVTLNQGRGEVCFDLSAEGLTTTVAAAHIHVGAAGVNGDIVVNFDVPANGLSGCVSADRATIKDIRQNPSDYYVNLHNATVPTGAVRGQLST